MRKDEREEGREGMREWVRGERKGRREERSGVFCRHEYKRMSHCKKLRV